MIGSNAPTTSPARTLAILAADAVHADLVRVDLLPAKNGRLISHLDGVVELTRAGADRAVIELLRVVRDRRAAAA